MSKKIIISIGCLALAFLVLVGFGCKQKTDEQKQQEQEKAEKIEINMWGLWDDSSVIQPFISEYQKTYPERNIKYRKFTVNEYEKTVVDSLAAGKGPDIWLIHHTWLGKHAEKLSPITGDAMSTYEYGQTFVDVVKNDFLWGDQIYGVALSVDTLALYYNKDHFNTSAIVNPPSTWKEFKEAVKKMSQVNEFGEVQQAGASIGTAKNINRAVDILYLLMLQNGTKMTTDDYTAANFNNSATTSSGENYIPGLDALRFYTDFANPKKAIYTWSPNMSYSVDGFVEEKVAMMFNYSYQNEIIKGKAPKLNYGVASVPQIEGSAKRYDYANYWGYVVSNASDYKDQSWDFLTFLSKQENVKKYCEATGRPASRRDVINDQLQNPDLKIFAQQALTARSWYQADPDAIESIFADVIESVALGTEEAETALKDAESKISVIMQ